MPINKGYLIIGGLGILAALAVAYHFSSGFRDAVSKLGGKKKALTTYNVMPTSHGGLSILPGASGAYMDSTGDPSYSFAAQSPSMGIGMGGGMPVPSGGYAGPFSVQSAQPLSPGGAGRNTLPGVINSTKWKGRVLNKYGR